MNEEDWARKFLYVPTQSRKIPLRDWKWVDNCPEGVDPRSEANPWVFTFDQTRDESLLREIRDRYPDWDDDWIRVASIDGYKWYNVDFDTDDKEHDAVVEDPDAISFDRESVTLIQTRGGWHVDILTTEDVPTVEGIKLEGVDYQGDASVLGVAGNPFHGSDDYKVKNIGRVLDSSDAILDGTLLSYDGESMFAEYEEPDRPETHADVIEASSNYPIDMFHFFPNKSTDERFAHPVHGSSTGSNMRVDSDGLARCERHNTTFNAYHFIGVQEGILDCGEWDHHVEGYAGKRDEILQACEERGIAVPAYWRHQEWHAELEPVDGMGSGDMAKVWEIRRELRAKAFAARQADVNGHLVGPKGSGKTHNIISLASQDDTKVFAAAPTKHKYDEIIAEAEDRGVSVLRLPSFPDHSALYDDWKEHYHSGAFPREIYSWEEDDVGEDEYQRRSDADWDDFDLLVGAPEHMFLGSAIEDRLVMADDVDLGTFRHIADDEILASVNKLLEQCSDEYESYQQLEREGEWSVLRREVVRTLADGDRFSGIDSIDDALELVQDDELDRRLVIEGLGLNLEVLDWARVMCGDSGYGETYQTYSHNGSVRRIYKRAPDLTSADQVWTLGATFDRNQLEELFDLMNINFDGVFGSSRHGDMERALDRWVIQTSSAQHVKSRSDGSRARPDRIKAIARGIEVLGSEFGIDEEAEVFSTLAEIKELGVGENYGSLTGTNKHSKRHLAVAGGAQHFGDDYVRDVAVSAGATPIAPDRGDGFKPAYWDCSVHSQVDSMMRWSGIYEAVTRVGRGDAETTLIAVDSAALPPWLQVVDQSDRVKQLSGAEREVVRILRNSEEPWQVKNAKGTGLVDVADYSAVRLYEAVDSLMEEGWLEVVGEGEYNAKQYAVDEDKLVSSGIKGFQKVRLTGDKVSEAQNPDWAMIELELNDSVMSDVRQTELTELI